MPEPVTFKSGDTKLAGELHLPANADGRRRHPAILCINPSGALKEQTASLYAARFAAAGYVGLTYDGSHLGDSGGEPRFLEEPTKRVEDIRAAADLLATLDQVDADRIGAIGIGAGGGYAVNAAMTDHRIRAVGAVTPINIGRSRRQVAGSKEAGVALLEEVGRQRSREAGGAEILTRKWIPDTVDEIEAFGMDDMDIREALDYYGRRAPKGNAANRYCVRSVAPMMAFDAFNLVEQLLTQPLQVIVGSRIGIYGSNKEGRDLYDRATCPKDILIVEGASHYDLYDKPEFFGQAADRLVAFFGRSLAGSGDPA